MPARTLPGSRTAASAKACSKPPRPTWPRSPRPARGPPPLRGTARSPCAPTGSSPAARSPSTSPSRSPTTASATPATRTPSPPKRPDGIYVLRTSVEPSDLDSGEVVSSYKPWPRSSGPSAPSIPTSHPPDPAPTEPSARTCSCGCCRTTSAGTCRPGSRPCCSPRRQARRPAARPARSPRRPLPAALPKRHQATPGDLRCTASPPCSPTCHDLPEHHHPRRPRTAGFRLVTTPTPSSGRPSSSSASATASGRVVSTPAPHPTKAQVTAKRAITGGTTITEVPHLADQALVQPGAPARGHGAPSR